MNMSSDKDDNSGGGVHRQRRNSSQEDSRNSSQFVADAREDSRRERRARAEVQLIISCIFIIDFVYFSLHVLTAVSPVFSASAALSVGVLAVDAWGHHHAVSSSSHGWQEGETNMPSSQESGDSECRQKFQ